MRIFTSLKLSNEGSQGLASTNRVRVVKSLDASRIMTLLSGMLLATGFGCGPTLPEGMPPLMPVSIALTQQQVPLVGATVVLHSDDGRWPVGGVSDELGRVEVWTAGKYYGAPAGEYRVTVVKDEIEEKPNPRHNPEFDNMPVFTRAFQTVDPSCRRAETTPITITLTESMTEPPAVDVGEAVRLPVR